MVEILYWNTHNEKPPAVLALEGPKEYDIIALQEMWINQQGVPYCPATCNYRRVFGGGRAALYVHKKHNIKDWTYEEGKDWCAVTLGRGEEAVTVYSIYSEIREGPHWRTPIHELAERPPPEGAVALVGDFNLHHPSWDRHGRTSTGVEDLLDLAINWGLERLTPWGEPTRQRRGHRDSTIDHAWVSSCLDAWYVGPADMAGSDHRPQVLRIGGAHERPRATTLAKGWSWALLDKERVAAEAAHIRWPQEIHTPEDLDAAADELIRTLTRIADAATPRRKAGGGRRNPWWNLETAEATRQARRAAWRYREKKTRADWEALKEAIRQQKRAIGEAQRAAWRRLVDEASGDSRKLWKLEKWARLRSHGPPTPLKIPALNREGAEPATLHREKAAALSERFFPNPPADLSDIRTQEATFDACRQGEACGWDCACRHQNPHSQGLTIDRQVDAEEISAILRRTGAWKAPGPDYIPAGFLKACGKPLYEALAELANASFRLEYFPKRFRTANVVVLRKPGKTVEEQRSPKAWRPISLLSTVGKVIEAAICRRITEAAEANGLLPEGQMGNRRERSTELAIRLLTSGIHTAWQYKAVATLLQLDIKGAFDTVNHVRLVDTLRRKGFPGWVLRWVQSYLTERSATLVFDGEESELIPIRAGVPQGSPLSPILFILYIATLYEAIEAAHPGVGIIGFADDTNLLVVSRDPTANARRLERVWDTCERWARTRGMQFEPGKSELVHFTRAHLPPQASVRLGLTVVEPKESARFLGVWLDRKLRWSRHLKKIKEKLQTQKFALTRLAASAWGCRIGRAREIYTKVIRSAIAYGASAYHTPGPPESGPRGIARRLAGEQSECLRVVAGAYRATPIRSLETETQTPPLDIYLSKRLADFEARLDRTGKRDLIRRACAAIATRLRRRRRRTPAGRTAAENPAEAQAWTRTWTPGDMTTCEAVSRDWRKRWDWSYRKAARRRPERDKEPADTPDFEKPLRKHGNLRKHESSLLVQIRTGKVGLRAFLFQRGVPTVPSPHCECGEGRETAEHVVLRCPLLLYERRMLLARLPAPLRTSRDFAEATANKNHAKTIVRWLLSTGRLQEYRVAERLARGETGVTGVTDHEDPEEGEGEGEEEGEVDGSEREGEGLDEAQVQPSW
jgi:hypothetical protein